MKTVLHAILCLALVGPLSAGAQDDPAANARRIQELRAKRDRGETLTDDDRAFVRKMLSQRQQARGAAPAPSQKEPPRDWSSLVPLTDLTGTYKGEEGGLYGHGRNEPPDAHRAAYLQASGMTQPLDAAGRPAANGKIGLVTIGFSNTNLESIEFKNEADADPQKSPQVVIVNGAIGGRAAVMWAYDGADVLPAEEQQRLDRQMDLLGMPKVNRRSLPGMGPKDTWPTLAQRIEQAGLTRAQVQVAWMKHVEAHPRPLGEFPAHAKALQADVADTVIIAKKRYPNLQVVYLATRTYAGWASPNCGSPEPFAYETAFGVRWLIESQIAGDSRLNYNSSRGPVSAPLLVWGPYFWAQGDSPRKADGFTWSVPDVRPDDHMHPSSAGCKKVATLLLNFMKTDAGAQRWFLKH